MQAPRRGGVVVGPRESSNDGASPGRRTVRPPWSLAAALLFVVTAGVPAAKPVAAWGQQSSPAAQRPSSPASEAKRRAARFLARRQPRGVVPAEVLLRARAAHAAMVQAQSASGVIQPPSTVWQPVGPGQVSTQAWNLVTGRVISLAADPSDTTGNTLYLGTEAGGIWKSTNAAGTAANVSFVPLTDTLSAWSSSALTSLSIGAVSVQPGGTGVILAGTGDPNSGMGSWYGVGFLRSGDGGTTWTLATMTGLSAYGLRYSFLGSAVSGFAWCGKTANLVVAALAIPGNVSTVVGTLSQQNTVGMYYSQDAGATWQLATIEDGNQVIQGQAYPSWQGNSATAVVWNPVRQRFYTAIRYHGYYESLDGITWTRLANQPGANLTLSLCPTRAGAPASRACPLFRGAIAVQPTTGDMFALTVDNNNLDQGLWQDACHIVGSGGCSSPTVMFSKQIADQPLESPPGSGSIPQADYDFWLAAVPSQQDTLLFVGTQNIWKCSLANSCVWRNATNTQTCAAAQVAPAQQAADVTFGSTGLLYFGNDGGLWRSTDNVSQRKTACSTDDANHFQNLNGGLGSLAEVESVAEDPAAPSTWLAALGPLGTAAPIPGVDATVPWNQVLDGEGDGVAIDPAAPYNWYATSESGVGINLCTEGTACDIAGFGNVAIGEAQVENDVQLAPAPWILDPVNTANLILGTCRVWRGPATGIGWSQQNLLSTMLDKSQEPYCDGNALINAVAAAPNTNPSAGSGAEQLYAGMAGALDGGGSIPGHVFTAAVDDGSQASTTQWLDRYSSPVTNQTSVTAQFDPEGYAISSIVPDPHDPTGQTIYVTVQGVSGLAWYEPVVYQSIDAGAHWTDITSDLPAAPANSVLVDPNNANIVYVAMDTGVYVTQNVSSCGQSNSACWNVYGSGLPNAPVIRLMAYNEGDTQTLRAATWGRGLWQVDLATAGIAPTTATILPSPLTFPPQQVQTTSTAATVTITNTGNLNLNLTSLSVTGDFAETDTCTDQSIALHATCQISVTFDPAQNGTRTGLLTVFGNVTGGQMSVSLSGTGLAPASVVLTPSALSFGETMVGSKSPPQYVTLGNTGDMAAAVTGATITGDFSISTNTCGATLAGQTSCTIGIVFTPSVAGTRSGTLTTVDSVGTQSALLSGSGESSATDAVAPQSLTFAPQQAGTTSAPQPVTLTNNGDQILTGIAAAITGDFTVVNNCGSLLQGHAACSFSVSYVPTIAGSESGTLTVTDQLHSQKVALSGTGVAPPGASALPASISFGGYAVGSTGSAQTVTVTNSGGYDITGLDAAATAGFALAANNCPATLSVGSACQLGVTFSPAAPGAVTGTLTVSATNLTKNLVVQLSGQGEDFGIAVSGSPTAIITSGQPATFALQLSGLSGSSGTVALTCAGAPQNATCTLNPTNIAVTGANTSSVTASIATGVATSSATLAQPVWKPMLRILSLALPLSLAGARRRKQLRILVLLVAVATLVGCGVAASGGSGGGSGGSGGSGGGGGSQNQTPPGTYTLTVTASMSNITHSVQLTLTVQ